LAYKADRLRLILIWSYQYFENDSCILLFSTQHQRVAQTEVEEAVILGYYIENKN